MRYASISSDARLVAVAGRHGLAHYNALSGRWKTFERDVEAESIHVVGGMSWWGPVLIVGTCEQGQYQVSRLCTFASFDTDRVADVCTAASLFERPAPVARFFARYLRARRGASRAVRLRLFAARLHEQQHVLSLPDQASKGGRTETEAVREHRVRGRHGRSKKSPRRKLAGAKEPTAYVDLSPQLGILLDPLSSWHDWTGFGDPADDLNVATIIFLISGRLVLLRPRRAASQEVKYDLQLLSSSIEFFWTHLSGIGTLENSLWGWGGGNKIQIWLDALTIEKVKVDRKKDLYESVRESVAIDLDFYPLGKTSTRTSSRLGQ